MFAYFHILLLLESNSQNDQGRLPTASSDFYQMVLGPGKLWNSVARKKFEEQSFPDCTKFILGYLVMINRDAPHLVEQATIQ